MVEMGEENMRVMSRRLLPALLDKQLSQNEFCLSCEHDFQLQDISRGCERGSSHQLQRVLDADLIDNLIAPGSSAHGGRAYCLCTVLDICMRRRP